MIYIWLALIVISALGILLGMYYYYKPDRVVYRRMRKQNIDINDTDVNFQKWLKEEFRIQVERTQKIGKMLVIFESIWLLVILILFFTSFQK